MKTLIRLLFIVWMLMISFTQRNINNATTYNTLTLRGITTDLLQLQQTVYLHK